MKDMQQQQQQQAVSQEQIENWKKQYGSVYRIRLETGEEYYVRAPRLKEIEYASLNLTQGKMARFGISLLKSCYIGGDELPENDDMKMMSAGSKMQETIEAVISEVEKL